MSSGVPSVPTTYSHLIHRQAARGFKVCPLCGTLNVSENCDCFVCGWGGRFDSSEATIQIAITQLLDHCPRAAEMALRRRPLWQRLLLKMRRRKVDMRL